jgi:hypothetical protein
LQVDVFEACMSAKNGDIEIAFRLREGAIELRGIDTHAGRHAVLYRQAVKPRPSETGDGAANAARDSMGQSF